MNRLVLVVITLATLLYAIPSEACTRCGSFGNKCRFHHAAVVQQQVVSYAVPVVANQYYFVGAPLRTEAIVQKAMQDDPDYAEFQEFKKWKWNRKQAEMHPQKPAPQVPDNNVPPQEPLPNPATSVLTAKCAECHRGAAPKAGILLDGTALIPCELKERIMKSVLTNKMPKDREPLTGEELGRLVDELFLPSGD